MSASPSISWLGQSCVRFTTADGSVIVDPYLSDSVAETYGEQFKRLRPSPLAFEDLADTRAVLITHAHLDHCDPSSVLGILHHAPDARVVAPLAARSILTSAGVPARQLEQPSHTWAPLFGAFRMHAVPAVHPTPAREANGEWVCVGYVIECNGVRFYHAGDTSPSQEIVGVVRPLGPTLGFLPVNERNYYRDRADIIGNMSVREALTFAEELGLTELVPIHWDLFAPNSVSTDEMLAAFRATRHRIHLTIPSTRETRINVRLLEARD